MTGTEIRAKRSAAGLSGVVVCKKAGIARSKLSDIERGYTLPTIDEVNRIQTAIIELALAKEEIDRATRAAGWPLC